MGGIAGWVDYLRDLSRDRAVLLAQLGSIAHRGPGGEWSWTGRRALLGQRLHGRTPARAPAPASRVVAAVDGLVYGEPDPAKAVEQAYLRWGADFPRHLEGTYAAAVWDGRDESLTLVRDPLGVKPMYYHPTADGVIFGSEPKAILAHPLVRPEIGLEGLRELLAYTATPGVGVIDGLSPVPPGGVVRITRDGVTSRRYWRVEAAEHRDDLERTVRTARELLEAAVERRLDAAGPVAMLLSGGLDSAALAAIASDILRRRGERLRTFSLGYADPGPSVPGPLRSDEDRPHATAVAAHLDTDHTHLLMPPGTTTDPVLRATSVAAQHDLPVAAPQFPRSLRVLCRAVAPYGGAAMGGNRANIVFGGVMGQTDRAVIDAGTYPWIASIQDRLPPAGLGTGLLAPDLLAKLDLPAYCADRYRADLAAAPVLDGESADERRMREIGYLYLQGLQEFSCILDDGAAASEGIELLLPYCDPALVQYMFNVPWAMKDFDGRSKSILRAAVADLLPEALRNRPPSPFPVGRDPGYGRVLRQELRLLLDDLDAPVRPLLDTAAARRRVEEPPVPERAWIDATDMELVLQLNQWLSDHGIRVKA